MERQNLLVPEAERTARAAETWTRKVMRRLEGKRFNVITLKWWGRPHDVPTFEQRHGLRGTFVAESAFLRGLARDLTNEGVPTPTGRSGTLFAAHHISRHARKPP